SGLGQQAGNFAAVTGGAASSGATSSSWGNYSTVSPLNGKNWLFLGEGTYDQGTLPSISQAAFTVFSNSTTFTSKLSPSAIVPAPTPPPLLPPKYGAPTRPPAPPPPIVPPPPPPPDPPPVVAPPSNPPAVVPTPIVNSPVPHQSGGPSRGYTTYIPPVVN